MAVVILVFALPAAVAAPQMASKDTSGSHVTLDAGSAGYRLMHNSLPYCIQGAAGSGSLERLHAIGGNSTRLWDAEGADATLDEAQKLGMTVTLGIWLGQERQGFNYNDPEQVARQYERVRSLVTRYRNHPALLIWAIGNEMEGDGSNAAVWSAINNLASLVKKLDPNHPVMTVIAEVGGERVRNLHRLCPDIDIVGINSYAGAASVGRRYRQAGGTKPYILTEYGPPGPWESPTTEWKAPIELSSTGKAACYRDSWKMNAGDPLCLGAYAFAWGSKQEMTATWFGMLLPDGSRLGAVDALQELWTGKKPASPCPVINSLQTTGPSQVDPGATVHAQLDATSSNGKPLQVEWVLQAENEAPGTGGDTEAAPETYRTATTHGDAHSVEERMPDEPGGYRIFAYVRDGSGGIATANIPILVKGTRRLQPAPVATLPLMLYSHGMPANPPYVPSGWMGNAKAVRLDPSFVGDATAGGPCLRSEYTASDQWAGVVWQSPANDWGDRPGGWNLSGAKRLAFRARGERGDETVTFLIGLIGSDKRYADSASIKLENVRLTREWKDYTMELAGRDLKRIKSGFAWTVAGQGKPVVIFLDQIRYE